MERTKRRVSLLDALTLAVLLLGLVEIVALSHKSPPLPLVGTWEAKGIRTGAVAYTRMTFRADGTGREYVDLIVPGMELGTSQPTTDQFTWHTDNHHIVIAGASISNTPWSVTDDDKFLTLLDAPVVTYRRVSDDAPLPPAL